MKLLDNLYSIQSQQISENKADFRVLLDAEHFIYKAHFPNNPITPGVCLIQMVVELFWVVCGDVAYHVSTLRNVKFTAPISPLEFPQVDVSLDFTGKQIKAVIKEKERVFVKMSLILV